MWHKAPAFAGEASVVVLSRYGFIVRFDDVFEGFEALAAIGVFAAGTCAIGFGDAGALPLFREVFFHGLVTERMAKADKHNLGFHIDHSNSVIRSIAYEEYAAFLVPCRIINLFASMATNENDSYLLM